MVAARVASQRDVMIQANPPSARAREIREAVARGVPPSTLVPMVRELSRQVAALFESAWQARSASEESALASVEESSEFIQDLLDGLAQSLPRSSTTQVLSALSFVERALSAQELSLPQPAQGAMPVAAAVPAVHLGRALLVEDEHAFMRVASTWLRDAGYEVTEVTRADDARRKLREERWDLLFVDVVLPGGGDGFDLADQGLRDNIGMSVVFATGYTPRARPPELRSWPMLKKPFMRGDCLDALERAKAMAATGASPT